MTATELQAPNDRAKPTVRPAPVSSNDKVAIPGRDHDLVEVAMGFVEDELEREPQADPRGAVEVVLRELVTSKRYDVLVQLARDGLIELVWKRIARDDLTRRPKYRTAADGSGKWDAVAETMAGHRDIFEARVYTGTEIKFLGDCTKADLIAGAEVKSKQANTMLDNAERMTKLARKLKAGQVVSDLDRETVEGVFNA